MWTAARLLLATLSLLSISVFASEPPAEGSRAELQSAALTPRVLDVADQLASLSLGGADAGTLIDALGKDRPDWSHAELDAMRHHFLDTLRVAGPGAAPGEVITWLAQQPAGAWVGHEEGRHHAIPLFNLAAAARGLENQWRWERGYAAIEIEPDPARLADDLARLPGNDPRSRGMRVGLSRADRARLDELATACATRLGGCGPARADIELARGGIDWLEAWVTVAPPSEVSARLAMLDRRLPRDSARRILSAAMGHPDPSVAARSLSHFAAIVPKDEAARRAWGDRLVGLLDHEALGAAAALQLATLDEGDWIEAAAAQPMSERARRRLSLIADAQAVLQQRDATAEATP